MEVEYPSSCLQVSSIGPYLSHINPNLAQSIFFLSSMHNFSNRSLTFRFPNQNLSVASGSPVRTKCTEHLILFDMIILIIFREIYELWNFSLCSFLQPHVASSFLGPNILVNTLFSNTPNTCSFLPMGFNIIFSHVFWNPILVMYRFFIHFLMS
jgi:hypothetical protein